MNWLSEFLIISVSALCFGLLAAAIYTSLLAEPPSLAGFSQLTGLFAVIIGAQRFGRRRR